MLFLVLKVFRNLVRGLVFSKVKKASLNKFPLFFFFDFQLILFFICSQLVENSSVYTISYIFNKKEIC